MKMRFVDLPQYGGPEVMRLAEGPRPTVRPGEVLVEVAYAGVNRPDLLQRAGGYNPPPGASPVLGLEVSGRIAAVGEGVADWRVGDAACALTPGGGYAEFVAVPAAHCLPVPRGWSLAEAASLPENYFTVWVNAFMACRLAPGESFLVHGGAGGIGAAAIQLAHAFGATVFTTAGNDEKVAFCRELGADHAFNYRTTDFAEAVGAIVGKRGVDVILDMVGGPYIPKNLALLATEGRLAFIAFLRGSEATIDFRRLMLKRQVITGSTLRARPDAQKAEIAAQLRERVWPLLEARKLRPVVSRIHPLAGAADAHRALDSPDHHGKVLLEVRAGA